MANSPKLFGYLLAAILMASPFALRGESKDPGDYPLRFHIFSRAEHNHYHHGVLDDARGEGHANLYGNGEVHGIDFSFDCGRRVELSPGYETYLAKWKKPGKQLVVLLPVMGKTGAFDSCNFDVDVKDIAYYSHNREVLTETTDAFKAWMVKHDYDPEHGKNDPVSPGAGDASPPPPQPPPPAQ